jgi:tetratricopeptide (TPR) repeat protein
MSSDERVVIEEHITRPFKEYLNSIATDCIAQFMEGNYEESILLGEEFLANGDTNNDISSEIHALIGLSYENVGKSSLALKHAELALQLSPKHKEALELYKRLI